MRFGSHIGLLLETVCVLVAVLGLLCLSGRLSGPARQVAVPWVLTVGALLPTLAQGRDMRELGLQIGPVRRSMLWLGICAVGTFAFGAMGVVVFDHLEIPLPLRGTIRREQWPMWVLFQFGLVALPEELFFRGYFQTNCQEFLRAVVKNRPSTVELVGVGLSAGVFAVAHVLILGRAASLLTFFPGLIFAWLFVRCGSLAPPVLLHGAANIGYVLVFPGVM
jgi:membrane protease YdiL (CAAX protease family)